MVKIRTVSPDDFDENVSMSPEHYIKKFERQEIAYRRRLTRLYRCHHLPHRICEMLSIPANKLINDIESLALKGVCLAFDKRCEPDFQALPSPAQMTDADKQNMVDDNIFYKRHDLSIAERCKLLMITRSRLRDLDKENVEPAQQEDIAERNQAIVSLFTANPNKRGLKADIAKTFNLSRKSIDLILQKNGINPITTSRKTKPKPSKAEIIIRLCNQMQDEDINNAKMIVAIAQKARCSRSYVSRILKKNSN